MSEIRDALARHLLTDRHRALLVFKESRYILDSSNPVVNLSAETLGAVRISYHGQRFSLSNVSGYVSATI
jgi:eukaryotic-like serine/threonine-protein kinase